MRTSRLTRTVAALAATAAATATLTAAAASAASTASPASAAAASAAAGCSLGGSVKHVIYLQFDNVHYTRDSASVPSDLEQMPNLLNFLTGNGTLVTHEHTPLIAHTANDIVTSETGLYGGSQGLSVSNEYGYYTPSGTIDTAGDFAYWTDPIVDYNTSTGAPVGDSSTNLVTPSGSGVPAPWVPYTRAGCNVGSVAAANTELENTTPDVPLVYGANSTQAAEAENPNLQNKAAADFEGLSVHCARGSKACAANAVPDVLPSEPGGYAGYKALYGNVAVQPLISPKSPVRNLDGQVIEDGSGDVGFPGYDGMQGTNALAYTLDMQSSGVPVTYTYLSDVHDSWTTGAGLGPGESEYEAQLKAENQAFGTFFAGLAAHGITKQNTLFVVTADEGDHFVGGTASPAGCDGVHVACSYSNLGEVDANLNGLAATEQGVTTPFQVEADSAPVLYLKNQPGRTESQVRTLERADAKLTAQDLATGETVPLTDYLADPVELNLLHMTTGDPKRTPTFVSFDNPDFWVGHGSTTCTNSCVSQPTGGDVWNHGDYYPQIDTTFLGLVGPGVQDKGVDNTTWSSHADIQPTMMSLLGLHDDYTPDGRVLTEILNRQTPAYITQLGEAYSQLDSPVGAFAASTLQASTKALASDTPGDAFYTSTENKLTALGQARDALVKQIQQILDSYSRVGRTAYSARPQAVVSASAEANNLLAQAAQLAKAKV
ncbi:hypothetical protein [Actinospica sp.]|uniref:hypothetical protein n=1 Tax=Actinospica sp. TaxID=1872142 RepID=UPI002C3B8392|nr:hypothetical protein [Actinospica sp.]HWG22806.1 hypothetical protein [Actinospica sp.]